MTEYIKTIFNSDKEYTSATEDFYKHYWAVSGEVKQETLKKNNSIINRFFPEGVIGKNVLEIGVGGEGGLLLLLKQCNNVHGIDVSDSAIINCRRFGVPATKSNLDEDALPFSSESIDVVFAFEVFEHFTNPQHALEEIRRVLKPDGYLVSSIPAVCTYHWPRLFYAGLFDLETFKDFLVANEFRTTCINDWAHQNAYLRYSIPQDVKSWSWYYSAQKVGQHDAQGFYEMGLHFWRKRNEYGLRIRPVEAVEMFRKSLKIDPGDQTVRLQLTHALLYRAINGDLDEYLSMLDDIISLRNQPFEPSKAETIARLLLIHIDSKRLGAQLLTSEEYMVLKQQLVITGLCRSLVDEIYIEEQISQQLSISP